MQRFLVLMSSLAALLLLGTAHAAQVDPSSLPEGKRTVQGLYLQAVDVPAFLSAKAGKALFLDVRSPAELALVGTPTMMDANVPLMFGPTEEFDPQRGTYRMQPNPNFVSDADLRLAQKGLSRADVVVVMCRSGGRSAAAANLLQKAGYKQVYSVVDGFEGDIAREGPDAGHPVLNGWKNAKLPWTFALAKEKVYTGSK